MSIEALIAISILGGVVGVLASRLHRVGLRQEDMLIQMRQAETRAGAAYRELSVRLDDLAIAQEEMAHAREYGDDYLPLQVDLPDHLKRQAE